jgi:hypothetical protein
VLSLLLLAAVERRCGQRRRDQKSSHASTLSLRAGARCVGAHESASFSARAVMHGNAAYPQDRPKDFADVGTSTVSGGAR